MKEMKEIPEAKVVEITDIHYIVICPYCQKKHYHGKGGGGGHRVAHCGDDFDRTLAEGGYNVVLANE